MVLVFDGGLDVDLNGLSVRSRGGGKVGDDWIVVLVFLADFALADVLNFSADKGFGHIVATRFAAGAAIVIREHFLHRRDTRVFLNVEENGEEDDEDAEDYR